MSNLNNKVAVSVSDDRSSSSSPFSEWQLVERAATETPSSDAGTVEDGGLALLTAQSPEASHTLAISGENIARGISVRDAFESAGPDADLAERLLHEFVAGEVPVIRELQNTEAALVALLGRTILDPALASRVASVLKETALVSAAVRRRAEGSLAAAGALRAQKVFISAHQPRKGHHGV